MPVDPRQADGVRVVKTPKHIVAIGKDLVKAGTDPKAQVDLVMRRLNDLALTIAFLPTSVEEREALAVRVAEQLPKAVKAALDRAGHPPL